MQYCYSHLPRFLPIDYRVIQLHDRYEVALLELYPNSPDREDFKVHHEGYLADYLDELMDCMSDDERYVVCARDGVLSSIERTDGQIASALGIKENKVEVLYQGAIDKIRKAATKMT